MSDNENICVGCYHSIMDGTIEGDMTLKDGLTGVDFKKLAVGEDSGCRNCAVILDAIVTHVGGEDRSLMQSDMFVSSSPKRQALHIHFGEEIEVIRHSGMSKHSAGTFELIIRKTSHAIQSLSTLMSGTSESPDRFRKILLRNRLFL